MILQKEIIKTAEFKGVPPDTIDKDWVLGHFLAQLFKEKWSQNYLVFKGGTCLKKCYYKDYRFSEDLDFTLTDSNFKITDKMIQSVCQTITNDIGIIFSNATVETIIWNDSPVGYQSHIKFWGANHRRNQIPPDPGRWITTIKVEIIHYEKLVNKTQSNIILDDYSDSSIINKIEIPCYSCAEIIAEKFRALLQRSYPAPRDYYDIWMLMKEIDSQMMADIIETFKIKAKFKNIEFNDYEDFFDTSNIRKVQIAWQNSLRHHLKNGALPLFEDVINDLHNLCSKMNWS